MNPTIKRYLISSLVTFGTAFFGVLALQLKDATPVSITGPVVFGFVSVAARAAFKALIEWISTTLSSQSVQG